MLVTYAVKCLLLLRQWHLFVAWFMMVHLADQPKTIADLSPQDSTLLSDVVELGPMPCVTQEDGEVRHYFYILTRYGLRYECSGTSKVQVPKFVIVKLAKILFIHTNFFFLWMSSSYLIIS